MDVAQLRMGCTIWIKHCAGAWSYRRQECLVEKHRGIEGDNMRIEMRSQLADKI